MTASIQQTSVSPHVPSLLTDSTRMFHSISSDLNNKLRGISSLMIVIGTKLTVSAWQRNKMTTLTFHGTLPTVHMSSSTTLANSMWQLVLIQRGELSMNGEATATTSTSNQTHSMRK